MPGFMFCRHEFNWMFAIKQQEFYGVWSLESTKTEDFLQLLYPSECHVMSRVARTLQIYKWAELTNAEIISIDYKPRNEEFSHRWFFSLIFRWDAIRIYLVLDKISSLQNLSSEVQGPVVRRVDNVIHERI